MPKKIVMGLYDCIGRLLFMVKGNMEVVNHQDAYIEKIRHASRMIVDEFINGGHLLGINCGFIALAVMIIFDFSIRLEIFIIAYLLTQAVYGFDHYHDAHNDGVNNTSRVEYVQRNKKIYPYRLGIFVGLFLVLLFYFGNALAIFMGISILALGLSYSLWCKNITKSIVGFKNIYVASSISLGIVFTSSFYQNNLPIGILFFTIYTTLSYFMNCSLCDMKDIESDKKQGLKTLPLVLGKQRFFLFIIAINTLIVSLLVILVYIQVIPFYFISLVGFNILWFFMIRMGMKPNIDYHLFTTKIMDSMEIFSFLFLFIGKTIMTMFVL